ncbi:MAG: 4-hydroxy-3-methylbut-2-en-1-yl diphosphate synthase, partial [candidate division CPR2 bacterium GW2011_GWD1_39_7]
MTRRKTRTIQIGGIKIGGDNPIAIQSMTNTDTRDAASTVSQIKKLEEAGCEIIRAAVPDMKAAEALREIKKQISISDKCAKII